MMILSLPLASPFLETPRPLSAACQRGHADVARMLLEAGCDPNGIDPVRRSSFASCLTTPLAVLLASHRPASHGRHTARRSPCPVSLDPPEP